MNHRNPIRTPVAALPLLFLAGAFAAGTCQAQKYTVTKLASLPGDIGTSASGMNNAGQVAGDSFDSNGDSQSVEWENAIPVLLFFNNYPGSSSGAVAINNHGVVIGDTVDTEHGVFETGPNVNAGQAYDHGIGVAAISDANVIVGDVGGHPTVWAGVDLSERPNGLPTTDGNFGVPAQPNGVNAAGVIVGIEYDWLPDYSDTYSVAVRWKPDPSTHEPGATVKALGGLGGRASAAYAINSNGWIVGWAALGNKRQHAALWEPTTRAFDLGTLGGKQSYANAINAEGDIAGEAQTASGAWHAVLWTHKHFTATDLNLEISPSVAKQITLISASATNDRCMVLANGVDNNSGAQESFVLSLTDQSQCNLP